MISTGPRWKLLILPQPCPLPSFPPYAIDDGGGNIIEDLGSPYFPYPHGEGTPRLHLHASKPS